MVAPWQPIPMDQSKHFFTPGRISRVYTTHTKALDKLIVDDWNDNLKVYKDLKPPST